MTTRVLVADDEPIVRCGLSMLLSTASDIDVVGEFGDGLAATEAVQTLRPDVAILDVRMPIMDGVEATRRITDAEIAGKPISVLVLSTYNLDAAVFGALRAGASGFLLKDAAPVDLINATRAVASGEAWLDPAVARTLITEFAARPQSSLPPAEDLNLLTPREREVLVLIGYALNNSEIAAHLVLGEGTVKTHVSRILMKLGLRDRTQAAVLAYRSHLIGPNEAIPALLPPLSSTTWAR